MKSNRMWRELKWTEYKKKIEHTKWNGFLWHIHNRDFLETASETSEPETPGEQTKGDIGTKKSL